MREFEEERQNMNAKERAFLKRNLITMLGILAVFVLLPIIVFFIAVQFVG